MKLINTFLLLASLTFINPSIAVAGITVAGSISGNLVLPPALTITEDMRITVSAVSDDDPNPNFDNIDITIAEAATGGVSKSFSISGLMSGINYTIQYDCKANFSLTACQNIVTRGFYLAIDQTTVRVEEASIFSGTSVTSGINLPVLTGKSITGTMSLPSGLAPAGGVTYSVRAQATVAPTSLLSLEVGSNIIVENTGSGTFKVTIPDDMDESWTIGYRCTPSNTHCFNNYIPTGYRKSGASNDTVEAKTDADILAGNVDSSSQDMTFLEGYSISGTISVPTPVTEASGLVVNIRVQDTPITFGTSVTIPQGETQTTDPYNITVSLDGTANWTVKYTCNTVASNIDCEPYITEAFYDDSEPTNTTTNTANKDTLDGGVSHNSIDMTLLSGDSISGKLQLSAGVAPVGGIAFTMSIVDTTGTFGNAITSVLTIPEGGTEVAYLINVEKNAANSYLVNFDCKDTITIICNKLSSKIGYYDSLTGNTVTVLGDATEIVGSAPPLTNIDLIVESSALLNELCVPVKTNAGGVAVFCL